MKLPLQKPKDTRPGMGLHWASCSPFIENSNATLIHRPRRVSTHKLGAWRKAHIGMNCWCGTSFSGTKKFTFLDAPPEGKLLCARCEYMAQKNGLPSADSLAGRHVHLGGVVAVQKCCIEEELK